MAAARSFVGRPPDLRLVPTIYARFPTPYPLERHAAVAFSTGR